MAETLVSIKRVQKYMQSDETNVMDMSVDLTEDFQGSNQETVHADVDEERDEAEDKLLGPPIATINENAKLSEAESLLADLWPNGMLTPRLLA